MNMEWDLINIRSDLAVVIAALATLVKDKEQREKMMSMAEKSVTSIAARVKELTPTQQ